MPSLAPRIDPNDRTRSGWVVVSHTSTTTPMPSQASAIQGDAVFGRRTRRLVGLVDRVAADRHRADRQHEVEHDLERVVLARRRQKNTMPASAIKMYAPRMANVAVVAMNPKYLNGSSHTIRASTRTRARVSAITVAIAAQGEPKRGCVHANWCGIPPSRAIANTLRAARLTPARAATNAPTQTARSTTIASQVPA